MGREEGRLVGGLSDNVAAAAARSLDRSWYFTSLVRFILKFLMGFGAIPI